MKTINPKVLPYILLILMGFFCLLAISKCNENLQLAENNKALLNYKNKVDSFKNSKGVVVIQQPVAVTNSSDDIKKLSAEIFDLRRQNERQIKEVKALITTSQKISIKDTSVITYVPTIADPIDSLVSINDCVLPPKKFTTENKYYSIAGTVLLSGVKIDSIELQNKISFRIAEQKKGWFKPRETVVQAINSNPYFNNTEMQSIVLKQETSFWHKWVKPLLFAAAALAINNQVK